MTFIDLIRDILRAHPEGVTPQQIRDTIKFEHPEFYGTESHKRNVERGHYKDFENALLAQIYVAARNAGDITANRTQRPLLLSISSGAVSEIGLPDESIESENLERLEAGFGTLYVLGTNLFTNEGVEIIRIGITTDNIENRVDRLYTMDVPFRFRVITQLDTKNYAELEQSIHKLLDPYRLNRSREFFTDKCLPYVEEIVAIHKKIHESV